jgi:hypothetical protein
MIIGNSNDKGVGFLFVKWQPSLFIRFVSFVSWTRSNECFRVSLEKTLPNEIQLNRDDDNDDDQLHSYTVCSYIYTHTYICVYLCIHCITITELNLSNIEKKKMMMNSETKMRIFYSFFLQPSKLYKQPWYIDTFFHVFCIRFLYFFGLMNTFFFYWQLEDDECHIMSRVVNRTPRTNVPSISCQGKKKIT